MMQIPRFEMERWQSVWENRVELNITESGVEPLTARELAEDPAALDALLETRLGYGHTNGSEELRTRIAGLYPGATAENVLVTSGCAEANFLAMWSLIKPGGEAVIMQPNYMQVVGLARGFGAAVKPLWLREELRWAPGLDELDKLVTEKTRVIAVCNPNNPTGAVLSEEAMKRIGAAADRVGATVLADEVYRGAELSGEETASFWGRAERVLCTAGLSKAYGLPGLRMGWVAGSAEQVEHLWACHDYTTISPAMLSDRLATLALEPKRRLRLLERTRGILKKNHRLVQEWVDRHPDLLTHVPPEAGAIAWVGLGGGWNTAELAERMRAEQGVLIVPGEQFEMPSYLRIGYGGDTNELREALLRLDRLLGQPKPVGATG
jgi:aspartate/methionine/tyrosine aminotransferase